MSCIRRYCYFKPRKMVIKLSRLSTLVCAYLRESCSLWNDASSTVSATVSADEQIPDLILVLRGPSIPYCRSVSGDWLDHEGIL